MTDVKYGYCEFEQVNEYEVRCPDCGRAFSGTPEYYAKRIICSHKTSGPGSELEKIFSWWSEKLKMPFNKTCQKCHRIKVAMDLNGKEWVRRNIDKLEEMIMSNAKAQKVRVPKMMVRKWLRKVSKV